MGTGGGGERPGEEEQPCRETPRWWWCTKDGDQGRMGSFIMENDRQPCEQAGWSCCLVAWLHSFPCMVCLPYIVVCGGDGDRSDVSKHLTNSIT